MEEFEAFCCFDPASSSEPARPIVSKHGWSAERATAVRGRSTIEIGTKAGRRVLSLLARGCIGGILGSDGLRAASFGLGEEARPVPSYILPGLSLDGD
jgi:hypothetical protein